MNRGFFIDVQGTLIDDIDKKPIKGACEFISYLNENSIPYVVITNNSKNRSEDFIKELKDMGFDIKNYIDPFYTLKEILKSKKIAAFGTDKFLNVLQEMGYEIDFEEFDSLVVSIKQDYTNEDYAKMIECAFKAKNLIAMHGTSTYSKEGKRYPGVGAIMSMIKFASNRGYEIVGKPSFNFYDKARALINLDFKDITVISDDMIGDLIGAQDLGMKTNLVLSGKVKSKDEINSFPQEKMPNRVFSDLEEALESLKKGEI
ncbi:HAD family hydrolase [Halarcobacter ebronensis]|uniref:HAD family hydrolase n=1 Tax=Halarcobacter ebronensis TaxID=1462615 RepID=A0A4V1LRE4_9BACT|nr:HAD-IIA family hydrolase [Halarcobacter ebronensis]RXJ67908.1 HAD family hydrolase [Halarcobacter ebronensis]